MLSRIFIKNIELLYIKTNDCSRLEASVNDFTF